MCSLLADAGFEREGVRIERKVYWVRGDAALVDFRPETKRMPELIHPTRYDAPSPSASGRTGKAFRDWCRARRVATATP